jgi:hypothetical protein
MDPLQFATLVFDCHSSRLVLLLNKHYLDDQTRRRRWVGHVARIEKHRNADPEGKRPRGRRARIWEDNIKIDVRVIGWEGVDWSTVAQDRDRWRVFINTAMNFQV